MRRKISLIDIENRLVRVVLIWLEAGFTIVQASVGDKFFPTDNQIDAKVRRLLPSDEFELVNLISLWDKLEAFNPALVEQTDQIYRLFLLKADLVSQLIQIELQFTSVNGRRCACSVQRSKSVYILLSIFIVSGAWDINDLSQSILSEFPNLANIRARADKVVSPLREL